MSRTFRNAVYCIEVRNHDHVCTGVKAVWADGEEIAGNVVPLLDDRQTRQIEATLGEQD